MPYKPQVIPCPKCGEPWTRQRPEHTGGHQTCGRKDDFIREIQDAIAAEPNIDNLIDFGQTREWAKSRPFSRASVIFEPPEHYDNDPVKIVVIPDCQVKPDVPIDHMTWIGKYIADKLPDVVVCIGDFADMPSLSEYDVGKKCFEGRRYIKDIASVRAAMDELVTAMRSNGCTLPRMVMTLGNHEDRIGRLVEGDARLEGVISVKDLGYEQEGWEVHPFLEVVKIGGVEFSHYFTAGIMGRPVSSAAALLRERMGSAVMGHTQLTDIAFHKKTRHCAMFVGTAYLHDEPYMTLQGNGQRRQIVVMNEVKDGIYDPMLVSLDYLKRRYGR